MFKTRSLLLGGVLCLLAAGHGWAWTDVKVNADTDTSTQNEPSITINRYFTGDLLNIVVAYNDMGKTLGVSYSPDSGKTWTDVNLPYVWQVSADPSVASDLNGNLYACFISYEGTWFYGKSGIFVSKSTDGGRTWLTPVPVDYLVYSGGPAVPFADKCMMTVDTNIYSPYTNNIYVAWQRDDTLGQNSDIYFARSIDGGLTFSTPIKINDNPPQTAYAEGAFPFVGADGDVYVCWYDAYFRGHVPGSLYVDKSIDGGVTFGTDVKVANILTPPLYTFGKTGFKAKSFLSAAADPIDSNRVYITYISDPDGYFDRRIDNGKHPAGRGGAASDQPAMTRNGNYLYVAWEDYRNGARDIYFNRSADNGQTWQLPDVGPIDNGDVPGGSAAEAVQLSSSGNNVYAVWQDYRLGGAGPDIYFNYSWNNGQTWQTDQHIDGSPTAMSIFPSIASTGGYVYVAWEDYRSGNGDIYFTRSTDSGKTWMTPIRIDLGDGAGANQSTTPRLACQGNNVYCLWLDMRNGGTMLPYFNYSSDYGVTWQTVSTQLSQGSGYNSQLPYRGGLMATGNYVYACWADDRYGPGISHIYFNRSTNNGVSWSTEVRISDTTGNNMAFTPSMDIQGNYVYITWEDYRNSGFGEIFFDYSSDNGATWQSSDIGPLNSAYAMPAMMPEVKSDGSYVYVTWYDMRRYGGGPGDIYFARSTNNGASWQSDVRINWGTQPYGLFPNNFPLLSAGNGYVNIVWADPRYFGQPNIYTNYSTNNGATWLNGMDEADVFCVRSTDGGVTWQTPVTVNDDGTAFAQVLPWVVVKENGFVDVSYYDFHISSLDTLIPAAKVRVAVSFDMGVSFSPSFAVQDTVVAPLTSWVGEYNGMAVLDTLVYMVFTDNEQTGNSDIFIDRTANPTPTVCCNHDGIRGDCNYDMSLNVADLTYLVDYLFRGGSAPPCPEEGDINGDGGINVADLTYLVDYLFRGGPAPAPC
jgi:hypothetical protein